MVDTPCDWPAVDPICCTGWDEFDVTVQQAATDYAQLVMWSTTGRQFGLCPKVVRPCGRWRQNVPSIVGFEWLGYGSGGAFLGPYIDNNGIWRNCVCPNVCCTCHARCEVLLPGPVDSVSEVIVDAATIPANAYRVDDARVLVRTDGECWPDCQDYNVDSGDGFFQVTYLRGKPVPDSVATAMSVLACEFAKACTGAPCRLPGRITSITRQGVQVNMVDTDTLIRRRLTGIMEVDQVILSYNPGGLIRRPMIWSPDAPTIRRVTSA